MLPMVILGQWGQGYYKSQEGLLCSAYGRTAVTSANDCRSALLELNLRFVEEENEPDWPKGCYGTPSSGFYWNSHLTGHPFYSHYNSQICSPRGQY